MSFSKRSLLPLFAALAVSPATGQTTHTVPGDFASIQAAIDASVAGDTVLVSPGTYRESLEFRGIDVRVTSVYGPTVTIVDVGHQPASGVAITSGEGQGAILEGFTIQNANASGIFIQNSSPQILSCIVRGNTANGDGGGIYFRDGSPVIANCLIYDNHASFEHGGGIYAWGPNGLIVNCTIMFNSGDFIDGWGGGVFLADTSTEIMNSIVRNNSASLGDDLGTFLGFGTVLIRNSNFGSVLGSTSGTGNIDADPLVVDAAGRDFHLTQSSPCIDGGTSLAVPLPSHDMEGDPRAFLAAPDMGADEFHPHLYFTGDPGPGSSFDLTIVGAAPGTICTLWIGSALSTPPAMTVYGDFFLEDRRLRPYFNQPIPADGLLTASIALPPTLPVPINLYAQAIAGSAFTNLETILAD